MQLLWNLTINEKKLTTTELNNNAEIFINAQICIITRSLHFVQNDGGGKKWGFVFLSSANFNNTICGQPSLEFQHMKLEWPAIIIYVHSTQSK